MSLNLSAIGNTIWNNICWAKSSAVELGRQGITNGRQFLTTVTPKLTGLLTKIRNLDVSSYLAVARAFIKTDAGVASGMLAAGIVTCILSQQGKDPTWKTAWLVAGVAFLAISAGFATNTSWLKPSFLRV
jgi:hypothetical protein